MPDEGRQSDRKELHAQIKVRRRMEPASTSTVSDLSLTGFRVRTHMKLSVGAELSVTLPGLAPRWAEVVWVRGFEAGCRFKEPLHQAVFDSLVDHSRSK